MNKRSKIAVLGGGGNGQTMAADFALAGHQVTLCDLPQFGRKIESILKTRTIEKIGAVGTVGRTGLARLDRVTTKVGDAVRGAEVIVISAPAYRLMTFFEALAKELEDGQIVVIVPGNWGALRLFNLLKKMGIKKNVKIGETDRCMFICRAGESWLGPGKARVILERENLRIAAMPAKDTEVVWNTFKMLYPSLILAANVLETSLNNANSIVHGPVVLMNAGWIEHTKGQFMFYRDGVTPAVGRVVNAIGDEKDAILRKLGFNPSPREPFYEQIQKSRWVHDPCEVGPPSLQHRYITEDIPYGLVPLALFGDLLDVPTPVGDAIIELASTANQVSYRKEGMTLEKLGLNGLGAEKILRFVTEGKV
jgi:opine dehydrogenase